MFTFNGLRVHLPIKVLGIKMPKKKRKSSLGRLTANAKIKQKTRLNEDEKTYSQRTEIEKERQVIGRINENSEHRDQRLAVDFRWTDISNSRKKPSLQSLKLQILCT